jgi:hypothetical protein
MEVRSYLREFFLKKVSGQQNLLRRRFTITSIKLCSRPSLCRTRVDCQTVSKLTCWVWGTDPSTLERKRAQTHQIGRTKERDARSMQSVIDAGLVGSTDPREQKMLKGHLPGVIYHQVFNVYED